MSDNPTRFCTITFMDGESRAFRFEGVHDDDASSGGLWDTLQTMANLLIELDGTLNVIPLNNVRSIEISPSPSKLPKSVVRAKSR